jgi:hypothetical protein
MPELTLKDFTDDELVTLLECARLALADGEIFDLMCDLLDITDEDMKVLREKLTLFLKG